MNVRETMKHIAETNWKSKYEDCQKTHEELRKEAEQHLKNKDYNKAKSALKTAQFVEHAKFGFPTKKTQKMLDKVYKAEAANTPCQVSGSTNSTQKE